MELERKLEILSAAAKYDASCASSGSIRPSYSKNGLGTTVYSGICHSFSNDGRCISLLKVLLSNFCIYDCAYCINRASNDIPRATFTSDEIVDLTINFYKRNYIEGLFLSSGVIKSPDHTMERMCRVVQKLRNEHHFNGYVHLKIVPGASQELVNRAGQFADRVSVNIELPSYDSLQKLAPQKKRDHIFRPMNYLHNKITACQEERKKYHKASVFAPAGQSTQLIVGASPESDYQIIHLSESLYQKMALKRIYYSAYVPINASKDLPEINKPPLLREHRLYQADWLLRFYCFKADEILDPSRPFLDDKLDPKLNWAIHHPDFFPIEIHSADYHQLLRVPGIGVRSVERILAARRFSRLRFEDLTRIGVVLKRAQYFITCNGFFRAPRRSYTPDTLKAALLANTNSVHLKQLRLF